MTPFARIAMAAVVVGLVVYLDARTKSWASGELRARGPRTVAGGHVRLRYTQNSGIAFGHWGRSAGPLIAYGMATAAGLAALLFQRARRPGVVIPAGLALLLAGTMGNLLDRIRNGFVVDFIDATSNHGLRWAMFNVADVALAAGLLLCLVGLITAMMRPAR